MSSTKSFCWIRTLAVGAKATEPSQRQVVQPCGTINFFAGGRPPDTLASIPASTAAATGGFQFWIAPENQLGRVQADTVFDYGPAFDREEDALCWITSDEGQRWDKEASNRFLMGFGVCDVPSRQPEEQVSESFDNLKQTPQEHLFPDSAWGRNAKTAHRPRQTDLLLKDIEGLQCPPIDHAATPQELKALLRLQQALRPHCEDAIARQAQSMRHAIAPVLQAAGLADTFFETADGQKLVTWVANTVDPVVYRNKRYFMRKRPGHYCEPGLQAMFGDTGAGMDRLHPGHPAYPSGHATHAYVWATLLQRCGVPPDAVQAAASAVAVNREIAGLHFASDTAAGQSLAAEIVRQMFDPAHNANHQAFIDGLTRLGLKP